MSRHISGQYDLELGAIRDRLMEMGGLVEQQVADAGLAFVTHDVPLADQVRDTEKRLNAMEVQLDDQCVAIIAKRQPAAGDLRNIIGIMKAVTDLERVGDEANRIAKMALEVSDRDFPTDQYAAFRALHTAVGAQLNQALDAFARTNAETASAVIGADKEVDRMYDEILADSTVNMQSNGADVPHMLAVIWSARALERVGDHAKNMAEYVIFQVAGYDIRHQRG